MSENAKSPGAEYQFKQLTAYPPDVLRKIQDIYDVSFPRWERKPFWYISDAMHHRHYNVFVVIREDEIVAFALLIPLPASRAMYIEYLAVTQALRGQGIGSLLFRSIFDFFENTDTSAIIWEVDPPEQSGDNNDRRIQFYERLGAHLIDQSKHYGMPNYYKGSGMLSLRMMWKPLRGDHIQPTKSELITFITDIYETEYRGQDAIRDEIIANLDKP
jgi:GNAT superfamily N-acetyltransferase